MNDKINRIKDLVELLNKASVAYYIDSSPIMTDYEYDKLYDELVSLEKETGTVFANSPTVTVEASVSSSLEKVEHPSPMLSLGKTKSVDDLRDFLGDKKGLLSWKLDGLTIVLTYRDGKLYSGVTRGNGIIGEVVTNNVKRFKNIPFTIPFKGELVVRGEAIIKYSDFNRMNDEFSDDDIQYKNPRNLCSGSVRQLDSNITAQRNVNCIIFALISKEGDTPNSKEEQFEWLESIGFECVERRMVTKDSIYDAVEYYKERIIDYDIPSDGLVLTYDDTRYGMSLGTTARAPKHSIAFKWKDETVESKLLSIDWSASRTGLINPVAVFEPVEIEGTIVNRASVHNISIMKRLKLGIGDTVEVFKANMIIPQIAKDVEESNNFKIPAFCPVCNHETSIIINNGIEYLYCTNEFCHAKFIKKLDLFTSRNAMNIDGISEQILSKLFKEGMLNEYADLYHLDRYKDKIINFEGFGLKSYENMVNAVEKSRKVKIANFINALGISEIGLSRAKLICKECDNDINKIRNISFEELANIDGVGDVIAGVWTETFKNPDFIRIFDNILKEIEFSDTLGGNNILDGKVFVITGSLNHYENRDELIEYIESLGGKVISSVSSNVDYLINNDVTSTSTKNKKAHELNIPIISEDDFINMVDLK